MKVGDVIRLKKPFAPVPKAPKFYWYAVVVGLVKGNDAQAVPPQVMEVVVNLYDPNEAQVYTDELGTQALYCFMLDEVEAI